MRNIIVNGLVSIMLLAMPSCVADVGNDTDERELASDQALDDEAPGASATPGGTPDGDLTGGQLDNMKKETTTLSCGGIIGPYPGDGGWWKYGIYNCYPHYMRAQAFRIDGSGGPCHHIAPYHTVWHWMQGNIVGIRGC